MKKVTITLSNADILTVESAEDNGITYYKGRVKSDKSNIGFEGDFGQIKEGESLTQIAEEIATFLNDNINS